MAAKPLHEVRRGLIVARVYRKRGSCRSPYSVSLVRIYRNGLDWKQSSRLATEDLPLARLVLDEVHRWIFFQGGDDA